MTRIIKPVCNANLIVAMLVAGGYIVYGLCAGLPIHEHFLGSGPAHPGRGSSAQIAPWVFWAIVESALLLGFIFSRYLESDMKAHRGLTGLFGVVGLYLLVVTLHSSPTSSSLDACLAFYVWGSHVVYAALGGDDA